MNRRSFLAGTTVVGVATLSGCLSSTLNTVTSLESTPASVEQTILETTGYQLVGTETIVTEEDIEAVGISETIVVTSHLTEYEKSVGIEGLGEQPTAMFSILSTPKIAIAGRTFNPVAELSSQELVELIADNYDEIDNLEHEADETVTVLDQSVEKARFVAEASLSGVGLELNIHVTEAAERGDDLVVAIGVYPRLLESEEESNVRELTEAISDEQPEPADEDGETTENDSQAALDDDANETEDDGLLDILD